MNNYWPLLLLLGLMVHKGRGGPVLSQMMNKVLGPNNPLGNVLDETRKQVLASSREMTETQRSPAQQRPLDSGQSKVARSAFLPPLVRARAPPTPRPLTALDINRGFGRVLSVVSILGQVDSYIAERARALVRKLLLLVDDDTANQITQY